jgi:acetyl-CoA acyltransferase
LSINDIGLIELNEALPQSLAVIRDKIKSGYRERKWGAIAMGHPLGCTGAKLSVQLFDEMKRRGDKYGIVTMCGNRSR